MRNRHVKVRGWKIQFHFKGKTGVEHSIDLNDAKLARIVKSCSDLPGYEPFQYVGEEGMPRTVDASDVNAYLDGITEEHFTAKDFRTWAGTVLACEMLKEFEAFGTAKESKRNVVKAVREVASHLGNTPAVCRKCYIHPAVLEVSMSGVPAGSHGSSAMVEAVMEAGSLRQEEAALMKLLQGSSKAKKT